MSRYVEMCMYTRDRGAHSSTMIHTYINKHITNVYMYVYIYIERERVRERDRDIYLDVIQ